jgi:glyoxylase-like metal-dependent hydrolase (beta-lactamase superfamily II)
MMTSIKTFCFNLFQENTYIVWNNDTKNCWIIDPGCMNVQEQQQLFHFIAEQGLKPVRLLNTHCHLDHVYGNKPVADQYGLALGIHQEEVKILDSAGMSARIFGAPVPEKLEAGYFINDADVLDLDGAAFKILFTPGHSPGSICFYNEKDQYCIVGDVLFSRSIGRTDLPYGDYDTLINSIKTRLYTLSEATDIYNGHGVPTSIAQEKRYNPFVRG